MNIDEKTCDFCDTKVRYVLVIASDQRYWTAKNIGSAYLVDTKRAPLPPEMPVMEVCGRHKNCAAAA